VNTCLDIFQWYPSIPLLRILIVGICNLSYRTALFMIVAEAPFAQLLPVSLDCPFWLPIRHSLTLFNVQGKLITLRIILFLGYRRRRCLTHCPF
jgi:hypothetical protein